MAGGLGYREGNKVYNIFNDLIEYTTKNRQHFTTIPMQYRYLGGIE